MRTVSPSAVEGPGAFPASREVCVAINGRHAVVGDGQFKVVAGDFGCTYAKAIAGRHASGLDAFDWLEPRLVVADHVSDVKLLCCVLEGNAVWPRFGESLLLVLHVVVAELAAAGLTFPTVWIEDLPIDCVFSRLDPGSCRD